MFKFNFSADDSDHQPSDKGIYVYHNGYRKLLFLIISRNSFGKDSH